MQGGAGSESPRAGSCGELPICAYKYKQAMLRVVLDGLFVQVGKDF
jgi:hypothetical protein